MLYDIGKIGIPDAILLKPGALNEDEWLEMRTHPEKGYRIVFQIPDMKETAEIVLSHEERFDGSGYPRGLRGEQICLGARLFAVIDTLDAITSDRPYRKANSFEQARDEIVRMSGTQFDPAAVQGISGRGNNVARNGGGKMYAIARSRNFRRGEPSDSRT